MPLSKPFKKAAQQISVPTKHLCKRMTKAEKTAAVILLAALLIRGLLAASLPMERIKDRPASLVVTDKEGAPLRGTLASDGEWRLPVPLAEMGKWMPAAAVEIEDRRFYSHMGVDLPAIFRALRQNIENGRVVSGASTITSQVIRLSVERKRTPVNKILEFIQATALESRLTKEEILEIYLNSVPFGGNTRGVEAAARTWFGKPAKELSLAEAA
ncbi:MAG: biosynthetic peptidoglycan transglycosylase, partial [Cloacibacillus sp.]